MTLNGSALMLITINDLATLPILLHNLRHLQKHPGTRKVKKSFDKLCGFVSETERNVPHLVGLSTQTAFLPMAWMKYCYEGQDSQP